MQISFPALLTVLFIALKLCGVIKWSWLWVFAPAWGCVVIWIGVIFLLGLLKALDGE
jgi:hypothetical protein